MVATTDDLLGIGLYTVEEAALYARVPVQTMSRWIYGNKQGESVLRPQLSTGREKFVTFLDFIQAIHVRQIRTDYNVPLSKIRKAIDTASKTYGVEYPLAREHTTYLFGSELLIKLNDDQFAQLSGKHAKNLVIHQVVKMYMKDLSFNSEGLADSFRAWVSGIFEVRMNPALRFGEPLVASCGYSAYSLWEAAKTEGSFEMAASAYGVSADEVEIGYKYYNDLQAPKAA